MAKIVPCRACGRELASDADISCPGCGTPDPTGNKKRKKRIEKVLFIVVVSVIGAWSFWNLAHSSSTDPFSTGIRQKAEALLTKLRY